ncbi:DNA/RNA non-specific endonuclease [Agromyces aerolatus]|uniref:DNA/RNA non-specific endonuclease n=1 Tax=Agromyces sp. LY-1074 TaxID=3074080 RepID=UPI00285434F6|nr:MULTISPECIES: DNA/RNA non-specific endonuclease [unclassified Agromyces]MDR5701895.1 DNA/RNA non-specific endonuclease [Agromyces sp. LY-1074]MDR5708137.1 DNA/RNA non-specific endonuclease [Agromyces sp. LY-1358]
MGFDAAFLGLACPMPRVAERAAEAHVDLDYVHFTVVLDTGRRFARVTGVNLDGAALVDVPRGGDRWALDERVPADQQAGAEIYAANDLDRGHLVRRRDPVWGEPAVAARANADTFQYPNAAPQASGFNQSKELWLGLEDHVLAFADVNRQRLSVFTAPVLEPGDPPYRGIRIPLRFWKIAAWRDGAELAAAGFVLDQTPLVEVADPGATAAGPAGVPALGPFRTFQVPIADLAALTGLAMPALVDADRFPPTLLAAGWREMTEPADLLL